MKKQKYHAFRKEVYLLGVNEFGQKLWLEAPSWDCNWYWGFGYIEIYNYGGRRDPSKCTDISSHSHWDSSIVGLGKSKKSESYCHNPFDSKAFKKTTFTEKEGWELAELFSQFYTMKKSAEFFHRGKSHVAETKIPSWKNEEAENLINKQIIPTITARILQILEP
jgi:hypothetical protein